MSADDKSKLARFEQLATASITTMKLMMSDAEPELYFSTEMPRRQTSEKLLALSRISPFLPMPSWMVYEWERENARLSEELFMLQTASFPGTDRNDMVDALAYSVSQTCPRCGLNYINCPH